MDQVAMNSGVSAAVAWRIQSMFRANFAFVWGGYLARVSGVGALVGALPNRFTLPLPACRWHVFFQGE